MMKRSEQRFSLTNFLGRLGKSASLVKSILLDKIVDELDVETSIGHGFLNCQRRIDRKTGEIYTVIVSKGGEAAVYVRLSDAGAVDMINFLGESHKLGGDK
jgi:hypothetical protein